MPIYEYACRCCETKFEKLIRSMTAEEKVPCPECGSTKTTRALSLFAVGAEAPGLSPLPVRPGAAGAAVPGLVPWMTEQICHDQRRHGLLLIIPARG